MSKTAVLNIRIDPEIKSEAEKLFSEFGLTVTDAVNVFLRQSIREGGFPFELKQRRYNEATEKAMMDAANGIDMHRCESLDQLFAELKGE